MDDTTERREMYRRKAQAEADKDRLGIAFVVLALIVWVGVMMWLTE